MNTFNCWCHQLKGNNILAYSRAIFTQQLLCTSAARKLIRALGWLSYCHASVSVCLLHSRKESYIQAFIFIFLGVIQNSRLWWKESQRTTEFLYDDKAQVKSSHNLGTEWNVFIFSFMCFKKQILKIFHVQSNHLHFKILGYCKSHF